MGTTRPGRQARGAPPRQQGCHHPTAAARSPRGLRPGLAPLTELTNGGNPLKIAAAVALQRQFESRCGGGIARTGRNFDGPVDGAFGCGEIALGGVGCG